MLKSLSGPLLICFKYKHAVAMSSGTDADLCACASLYEFGAKRGDEIILPRFVLRFLCPTRF